jgi:hypothetical protein
VGYFKTSLGLETPEAGNSPGITGDLKKLAGQINALLLKQLTTLVELAKLKVTETIELPGESITAAMLKALAVTTSKIGEGAVTTAKLGNEAVETSKIGEGAVTTAKLGNEAVETSKIKAGAVTRAKMETSIITDSSGAPLKIQTGSTLISSGALGTGVSTQTITLPTAWANAHVAFFCAILATVDSSSISLRAASPSGLSEGILVPEMGGTSQSLSVIWVSIGY